MKTGDHVLVSGLHFSGKWPGTVVDIWPLGKISGREWREAAVELDRLPGQTMLCLVAEHGEVEIPACRWQIAEPMPVADEPQIVEADKC